MLELLRRKKSAMDPCEVVVLSVVLDEWCRRHGFKHGDAVTQAAVMRMIEVRASGGTLEDLKAALSRHVDQSGPTQPADLVTKTL